MLPNLQQPRTSLILAGSVEKRLYVGKILSIQDGEYKVFEHLTQSCKNIVMAVEPLVKDLVEFMFDVC